MNKEKYLRISVDRDFKEYIGINVDFILVVLILIKSVLIVVHFHGVNIFQVIK